MSPYVYLGVAILFEVIATSALKASNGMTRLWPAVLSLGGYGVAFYYLSVTLRQVPVGVAYAIWSGAGTLLITLVGWLWFRQRLDAAALIGLGLIVSGVVVLNLWSSTASH